MLINKVYKYLILLFVLTLNACSLHPYSLIPKYDDSIKVKQIIYEPGILNEIMANLLLLAFKQDDIDLKLIRENPETYIQSSNISDSLVLTKLHDLVSVYAPNLEKAGDLQDCENGLIQKLSGYIPNGLELSDPSESINGSCDLGAYVVVLSTNANNKTILKDIGSIVGVIDYNQLQDMSKQVIAGKNINDIVNKWFSENYQK